MNTPSVRGTELRSSVATRSSSETTRTKRASAELAERPGSSGSDVSSGSSNVTTLSRPQGSIYDPNAQPGIAPHPPRTSSVSNSNNTSTVTLPTFTRPSAAYMPQNDPQSRKSPRAPPPELQRHRPRQHSQGFFEPSLPTATLSDNTVMANLSASQIAAQAAMQHQASNQHLRKRSQTIPNLQEEGQKAKKGSRESPPPPLLAPQSATGGGFSEQSYQNGLVGGRVLAATTAANAAFPRSPGLAPSAPPLEQPPEREHKHKGEKSKMKLFSKPKHIALSRDKEGSGKDKALPSPNKMGFAGPSGLSRMVNASTSSLADTLPSGNSSMYNLSNTSQSTVVPADRQPSEKDKEKEKHKHHFLSRQKLKLKDKDDHYHLPLSSASSNSRPLDPNAPQSLYSFTPSSPAPSSTAFGKSVTGLDLLHGGRALREKKKEEKAIAAAAFDPTREQDSAEWPATSGPGASQLGPGASTLGGPGGFLHGETAFREALQGFGLNNMTAEDAWDFLKAKLLVIFDGEDVRFAIEDLNKLVIVHIQRCVQKLMPHVIVEDLRELLHTGFASLGHSLTGIPDEKLVPHLVQIWMLAFGKILPFIQAVFLPLDLEFKGRGSIMSSREAKEFWGALPSVDNPDAFMGDELDVRTIVLVAFRDTVILSRYEGLKATFSRLSLDNINAGVSSLGVTSNSSNSGGRPGTATSLDPGLSSYNSQSSTLLNAAGSYSSDTASLTRSRAESNTSSNPDQHLFQSFSSPSHRPSITARSVPATTDSSHIITETVGRMLQCVSVLASVQTGDEPQEQIETLSKTLKHNWLGRGRTGRDRRGFVGTRIRPAATPKQDSDESQTGRTNDETQWNGRDGGLNLSML
ncbi:hypothetical protein DTO027B5_2280 [Paecilomyces variotii]|nr:hypothetical protein DTO027B3_930 [Paecilomyces variotii]KAJ9335965.1 hypothetical protein DTO027B5_2280 [Paecilomyces variotii]KAJ9401215.1 hypothetical protein DTO282F9_1801 [Paecilomyces variotii]